MKEFKKWQKNRELKTIGYLTNSGAYEAGEEKGWRAALEMVHKYMIEQEPDAPYFDYVLLDKIEKELEE